MVPKISIIIPCFNSGKELPDALESIRAYPDKKIFEVIIVNDGSTDSLTLELLESLKKNDYYVIDQVNKGPAGARNTAVRNARGEYLLFLDSDNKIRQEYITKGIQILNDEKETGIVYGNPAFFGASTQPRFTTQAFDFERMLGENYIDMCAVIRKAVWEDVGGFDEERLLIGHEDWDFWIRAFKKGWKFHYINSTMFDYRIGNNSLLVQSIVPEKKALMFQYLVEKHIDVYSRHYTKIFNYYRYCREDEKSPFRTLFKHLYKKYLRNTN